MHTVMLHIAHLLLRTLDNAVAAQGKTRFGLLLALAIPTLVWADKFFRRWRELRREHAPSPAHQAFQESMELGKRTLLYTVLVAAAVSTWFLISTIYQDHELCANSNRRLQARNLELQGAVQKKRQNLDTTDPAFQNMMQTIGAFMTYRQSIGPRADCHMLITAPKDAFVAPFSSFAVLGTRCMNGNLQNIGVKPENEEEESLKGALPGMLVLHAYPGAKGADRLVDMLSSLIQTRRSYTFPTKAPANTIWIQFGPGTRWNTDLNTRK